MAQMGCQVMAYDPTIDVTWAQQKADSISNLIFFSLGGFP